MYTTRNSGLSSFSAKNSMWSSLHESLVDLLCVLVGKKVRTRLCLSSSASCHGVVARGYISLCCVVRVRLCVCVCEISFVTPRLRDTATVRQP